LPQRAPFTEPRPRANEPPVGRGQAWDRAVELIGILDTAEARTPRKPGRCKKRGGRIVSFATVRSGHVIHMPLVKWLTGAVIVAFALFGFWIFLGVVAGGIGR
jgi:hypothetical protein